MGMGFSTALILALHFVSAQLDPGPEFRIFRPVYFIRNIPSPFLRAESDFLYEASPISSFGRFEEIQEEGLDSRQGRGGWDDWDHDPWFQHHDYGWQCKIISTY